MAVAGRTDQPPRPAQVRAGGSHSGPAAPPAAQPLLAAAAAELAASAARVAQAYEVIGSTGPERDDRYTRRNICTSRAATKNLVPAGCGSDGTGTTAVSKSSSHCSPQVPPGSTKTTSS